MCLMVRPSREVHILRPQGSRSPPPHLLTMRLEFCLAKWGGSLGTVRKDDGGSSFTCRSSCFSWGLQNVFFPQRGADCIADSPPKGPKPAEIVFKIVSKGGHQ